MITIINHEQFNLDHSRYRDLNKFSEGAVRMLGGKLFQIEDPEYENDVLNSSQEGFGTYRVFKKVDRRCRVEISVVRVSRFRKYCGAKLLNVLYIRMAF